MALPAPEYGRPSRLLLHFSDTHLIAGPNLLYGTADADSHLRELLASFESSGAVPDAMIFTGDLTDKGEPEAYAKLRAIVEPIADKLGCELVWLMGNHDDRSVLRRELLDLPEDDSPLDYALDLGGLRLIVLDSTVPGEHYGELGASQLQWLADELARPAPLGSILAMHHPPIPCVQERATVVELRGQRALASVVRGSDVRSILGGHLHYSTSAMFAGIPVSVAAATSYNQDLNAEVGGVAARTAGNRSTRFMCLSTLSSTRSPPCPTPGQWARWSALRMSAGCWPTNLVDCRLEPNGIDLLTNPNTNRKREAQWRL